MLPVWSVVEVCSLGVPSVDWRYSAPVDTATVASEEHDPEQHQPARDCTQTCKTSAAVDLQPVFVASVDSDREQQTNTSQAVTTESYPLCSAALEPPGRRHSYWTAATDERIVAKRDFPAETEAAQTVGDSQPENERPVVAGHALMVDCHTIVDVWPVVMTACSMLLV